MSHIKDHAKEELRRVRADDEEYNGYVEKCILEIVELVADQYHSDGTINKMMDILPDLLNRRPLSPLTGEDDEWRETAEPGLLQNKRMTTVFKDVESNQAYNIEGRRFVYPDGTAVFRPDSSYVEISFPCMPKTITHYIEND